MAFQRIHGQSGDAAGLTYRSWKSMRHRCNNPNSPDYHRYGGRGIKVCKRWSKYTNFLIDMGERPEGMTLERRKNNLGYMPSNCYWATAQEQSNNRRSNRRIEAFGETKTMADWTRDQRCKVKFSTLCMRLKKGWLVADALTEPAIPRFLRSTFQVRNA